MCTRNNFPICLAAGGRIAVLPLVCIARYAALGALSSAGPLSCIPSAASKSESYSVYVPWQFQKGSSIA